MLASIKQERFQAIRPDHPVTSAQSHEPGSRHFRSALLQGFPRSESREEFFG